MAGLNTRGLDTDRVWDTEQAFLHFHSLGKADTKRTAERHLHKLGVLPAALSPANLEDEQGRPANQWVLSWALATARRKRKLVLFVQLHASADKLLSLHANDARGARYWVPLIRPVSAASGTPFDTARIVTALKRLQDHIGKEIAVFPHGELVGLLRGTESLPHVSLAPNAYPPILELHDSGANASGPLPPYLEQLEAESIYLLREAMSDARKPVMLYSGDKDSSVLLHLARKAFFPAPPPAALMLDTRCQFQEMTLFRDHIAQQSGMHLPVHDNPFAINNAGSLRQALKSHQFDVVFSAAGHDDETWCAREPIFPVPTEAQHKDVNNQRPRLWHFTNTQKNPDDYLHISPMLHWTELDIWHYIYLSAIPVAPLYFAKKRLVAWRDGALILVDDDAFRALACDEIFEKQVRIRTLSASLPLSAIASTASSVAEIMIELIPTLSTEKQVSTSDRDAAAKADRKNKRRFSHGSK